MVAALTMAAPSIRRMCPKTISAIAPVEDPRLEEEEEPGCPEPETHPPRPGHPLAPGRQRPVARSTGDWSRRAPKIALGKDLKGREDHEVVQGELADPYRPDDRAIVAAWPLEIPGRAVIRTGRPSAEQPQSRQPDQAKSTAGRSRGSASLKPRIRTTRDEQQGRSKPGRLRPWVRFSGPGRRCRHLDLKELFPNVASAACMCASKVTDPLTDATPRSSAVTLSRPGESVWHLIVRYLSY